MLGLGIVIGMITTIREMFTKPITIQYPYEKWVPYDRCRGYLAAVVDESGEPLCRACGVCAQSCPDRIITVEKDPQNSKKARELSIEMSRCMFCGLCEEGCAFGAIRFVPEYETAQRDFSLLTNVLIRDGKALRPAHPRSEAAEGDAGEGPTPGRKVPGRKVPGDPSILRRKKRTAVQ